MSFLQSHSTVVLLSRLLSNLDNTHYYIIYKDVPSVRSVLFYFMKTKNEIIIEKLREVCGCGEKKFDEEVNAMSER